MVARMLNRLALLLLLAGWVASSTMPPASVQAGHDSERHEQGNPCADPGHDGAPCGPDCACACCQGHLTSLALVATPLALDTPRSAGIALPCIDAPTTSGHRSGVFRPPRG